MEPLTLGEWYLDQTGGAPAVRRYRELLASGCRIGQAFFNSLTNTDRERIRGTARDPFYRADSVSVHRAIEWLIDHS